MIATFTDDVFFISVQSMDIGTSQPESATLQMPIPKTKNPAG
jgi:hypothetical protein